MKKAKLLILSLLLTNSSLWAIDAQSLKEGALGLWDKSKDVADTVGEKVRDTWDDSEPLREAIKKSKDDSAVENSLKELWEKMKDGSKQLGEKIQENTKSLL